MKLVPIGLRGTGPTGPAGPTGATGPAGAPGTAVTLSDTDPGAIGIDRLWVRLDPTESWPPTLYIRDETNTGWVDLAEAGFLLGSTYYDSGNKPRITFGGNDVTGFIYAIDASGNIISQLTISESQVALSSANQLSLSGDSGITVGSSQGMVVAVATDMTLQSGTLITLTVGGAAFTVTATGIEWLGNVIGTQCAFVNPATATPQQIALALIASKETAAS